jgi:hypothetical protein
MDSRLPIVLGQDCATIQTNLVKKERGNTTVESDKVALPVLSEYKQKMDAAVKENTGTARESFVTLCRQVQAAMVEIEGRKNKWRRFWKVTQNYG